MIFSPPASRLRRALRCALCGRLALFLSASLGASGAEILLEAESATLKGAMAVRADADASGEQLVAADAAAATASSIEDSAGYAEFRLQIPATGVYTLWGRLRASAPAADGAAPFFVTLGDRQYRWHLHAPADVLDWHRLALADPDHEVRFQLEQGQNVRLRIHHRLAGVSLDQVRLVRLEDTHSPELLAARTIRARTTTHYRDLSPYFAMPDLVVPSFPDRVFDIRDFGAVAGGEALVTDAVRAAIAACHEAGGGRVLIPSGQWLSGAIHLQSNVDLHVAEGAVLRFSTDRAHYLPAVFTRWEGMECVNYSAPIYAHGATNIALTGDGLLDGQGAAWWEWRRDRQKAGALALYEMIVAGVPPLERVVASDAFGLRPNFVQFIACRGVLIENLTFTSGPMWTIHPVYCTEMVVRGIKVITEGPNNDGINPDSTQNLLIEDCYFSTGDDCVVLKAGLNEDGWRVGRPTENVVIRNIYGNAGHGGIVVGSEMSGGVRNVYAHDLTFEGTDRGIRFKSMRGRGGVVENIWIENVRMRDIGAQAIRLNMFYSASTVKPLTEVPALFRNIFIRDVVCDGAARAIDLIGLPEAAIENIQIRDTTIRANRGASIVDGARIFLDDVTILPETGPAYEIRDSAGVVIATPGAARTPATFLDVRGERSGDIRVSDWRGTGTPPAVIRAAEVPADAVVVE